MLLLLPLLPSNNKMLPFLLLHSSLSPSLPDCPSFGNPFKITIWYKGILWTIKHLKDIH